MDEATRAKMLAMVKKLRRMAGEKHKSATNVDRQDGDAHVDSAQAGCLDSVADMLIEEFLEAK